MHLNWTTKCRVQDERWELEQRFERMVMGHEYDSWKCGKKTQHEFCDQEVCDLCSGES